MNNVRPAQLRPLPPPAYKCPTDVAARPRIGLAVESMKRHMTDEGWQVFDGLQRAGYFLFGYNLPNPSTDVYEILRSNPAVAVVQDKREWDVRLGDFRERRAKFTRIEELRVRDDVFKVTLLKDAQQRPEYHAESAREMGCHAWIIYYHPDRVTAVAPYVRREHLIRTYHTVDEKIVPPYTANREYGCLLSGAVSSAYPLRQRLFQHADKLPQTVVLQHPGYHCRGCATPRFVQYLSQFKVAVCTASRYGYALRKIVEATASGCVVITDLPEEDCLPEIDGNLIRVPNNASVPFVADVIGRAISEYSPERQRYYSDSCKVYYDFRAEGKRLAEKIEALRERY